MQGDIKSKPILFNTAMVQAILDGRKTVTRRVVKPQPTTVHGDKKVRVPLAFYFDCSHWVKPPYQVGDVLWVRETWQRMKPLHGNRYFVYKADIPRAVMPWRPSIHMPKEAARIFLKVTDVRVERLQDITWEECLKEGVEHDDILESPDLICNFCPYEESQQGVKNYGSGPVFCSDGCGCEDARIIYEDDCIDCFRELWNSTIKKKDIEEFGWDANPFVWAVEFERLPSNEVVKNA